MLALVLVAASLGASNFAAVIGIGIGGVDARLRIRVGIAFGLFEGGMPLIGLAIGRQLASTIGSSANLIAGGLLIATGLFTIVTSRSNTAGPDDDDGAAVRQQSMTRLLISGAALSIDNLIVGFALGTYRVSLAVAATDHCCSQRHGLADWTGARPPNRTATEIRRGTTRRGSARRGRHRDCRRHHLTAQRAARERTVAARWPQEPPGRRGHRSHTSPRPNVQSRFRR